MAKHISLIRRHETEMNELHQTLKDAYKSREHSSSKREDWQRLAARFRSYRSAVDDWLEDFEKRDTVDWEDGREFVFDYFKADPFYFRSGYATEMLVKFVKRLKFTASEKEIIRDLIIRRIENGGRREFKKFCQLIPRVQTSEFELELTELSTEKNPRVARRAEIAKSYLSST